MTKNATNAWQALGGQRAAVTGTVSNPNEYFYYLKFISTASDGTDPQRKLSTNSGGTINPSFLPTDTLGPNGSWAVSVNVPVGGTDASGNPVAPIQSSDPNGIYGAAPSSNCIVQGQIVPASSNHLYAKDGSDIYGIDSDLATAIFIRTGEAVFKN